MRDLRLIFDMFLLKMNLTGGPDNGGRGNPPEEEPEVDVGRQQLEAELREVRQGGPWTLSNLIDTLNLFNPFLVGQADLTTLWGRGGANQPAPIIHIEIGSKSSQSVSL